MVLFRSTHRRGRQARSGRNLATELFPSGQRVILVPLAVLERAPARLAQEVFVGLADVRRRKDAADGRLVRATEVTDETAISVVARERDSAQGTYPPMIVRRT